MRVVSRSALLPFSAVQMFDLVNDVAGYPDFLPWCSDSEILARSNDEMRARLTVARAGFSKSFTTRNRLSRPQSIDLSLVEGPFSDFEGHWRFTQLGEDGCKVEMQLRFSFSQAALNVAFGKIFEQAADSLVDAFCVRARQVYGNAA